MNFHLKKKKTPQAYLGADVVVNVFSPHLITFFVFFFPPNYPKLLHISREFLFLKLPWATFLLFIPFTTPLTPRGKKNPVIIRLRNSRSFHKSEPRGWRWRSDRALRSTALPVQYNSPHMPRGAAEKMGFFSFPPSLMPSLNIFSCSCQAPWHVKCLIWTSSSLEGRKDGWMERLVK